MDNLTTTYMFIGLNRRAVLKTKNSLVRLGLVEFVGRVFHAGSLLRLICRPGCGTPRVFGR